MLKVRWNPESQTWEHVRDPRRAQAKWDKRHLVTVSTHLTRRQWEALRRICARNHVTVYAIVREFLLQYIRAHDA